MRRQNPRFILSAVGFLLLLLGFLVGGASGGLTQNPQKPPSIPQCPTSRGTYVPCPTGCQSSLQSSLGVQCSGPGVTNGNGPQTGNATAIFTASTGTGTYSPNWAYFFGNITSLPYNATISSVTIDVNHREASPFSQSCYLLLYANVYGWQSYGVPSNTAATPVNSIVDLTGYPTATPYPGAGLGPGQSISWYRILGPQPQTTYTTVTGVAGYPYGYQLPFTTSFKLIVWWTVQNTLTSQVCTSYLYSITIQVNYGTGTFTGSLVTISQIVPSVSNQILFWALGTALIVAGILQGRKR